MRTCVNCGHQTDTPHCPSCGQKMEVKRVTFRTIFEEFLSKWIGFDNQFGRTVIDLTVKPANVILSYLKGNRTRYLGPLGYIVIMTALLIISFDLFGLEVSDFLKENSKTFNPNIDTDQVTQQQKELQDKMNQFMARNFRFVSGMMIPFYALTFGWFYRKEKLNYVERVVITTYSFCHSMWITILALGIFAATGQLFTLPLTALSIVYLTFVAHKTFPRKNVLFGFLRVLGTYLSAILVFGVVLILALLIIGVIAIIRNPELLEKQG